MKFGNRLIKRLHGGFRWIIEPARFFRRLRKDDNRPLKALRMIANRASQSDLRLQPSIIAALARSMEKQNDRPFPRWIVRTRGSRLA